jgi:hypothetical protein
VAAIEYSDRRPVGQVNSVAGQRIVLPEALSFMEKADNSGAVYYLPFTGPQKAKPTKWQPRKFHRL